MVRLAALDSIIRLAASALQIGRQQQKLLPVNQGEVLPITQSVQCGRM
jgi:hypothetical protein